ncbi:MAG: hypothetical protein GY862_37770 [Gammaproteobacteria bacterium]|nr:hypothetical protein [Gammaproteobacteria bacterium]
MSRKNRPRKKSPEERRKGEVKYQAKEARKAERARIAEEARMAEQARIAEFEREVWRFSAIDSLFFRESRPMDAIGGTELASVFPPPAQTMMGALRSIIGEKYGGVDWAEYRNSENHPLHKLIGHENDLANLEFHGPWISRDKRRLYPAPANLMGKWEKNELIALEFLRIGKPCECDLGKAVCLPCLPKDRKGYKPLNGHWLTHEGFETVLCGEIPDIEQVIENKKLFVHEARQGLELDDVKRTAQDKQLYQTRHLRLCEDVAIELDVTGIDKDNRPEKALTRLGGEGRLAVVEVDTNPAEPVRTPPFDKGNTRDLVLYVLTPVYVEQDKLLPGFNLNQDLLNGATTWRGKIKDIELTLFSAAMDKPMREGGWDLIKKEPRTVRSLIPAGSVFYCRAENNADEFKELHHCYLNDTEKALGRGLLAAGLWRKDWQER